MKTEKNDGPISTLSTDSQNRLIAYTTAASLGAFFAGHSTEAQVVESQAFAPYPHTIIPGAGTGAYGSYHYFSVDGGNTDFNLEVTGPLTAHPTARTPSQIVDLISYGSGDLALTPTIAATPAGRTNNAYAVSFMGGSIINSTTASPPYYQPRLAICYNVPSPYGGFYSYVDNKYITTGSLGFQFTGSTDGQTHFGYMDVQVNTFVTNGFPVVKSVVIKDVYYNATANASITVPVVVAVTNITLGALNSVTIGFTSNDGADPSTFTLETSPTLGPTATWTTDVLAVITQTTTEFNGGGVDLAQYQAVTVATGGKSQFYRIKH